MACHSNMVTMSNLEASEVDLNGAMNNYLRLAFCWFYFLYFSLTDHVDPVNVYVENCHACVRCVCMQQSVLTFAKKSNCETLAIRSTCRSEIAC